MDVQSEKAQCAAPVRPYVIAYNEDYLQGFVYRVRCGKWSCEYCADLNKSEWAYTAIWGMENLSPDLPSLKFVTVTHRDYVSREKALVLFKTAWPKLIRRVTYAQEQKPEYLLVPERHKSGKMHAHFLITSEHHPDHWWHDQAFKSGLGYQAKELPVSGPAQAGWYVSKELTKQLKGQSWPKNFRRVRLSLLWPRPPDVEKIPGWVYETYMREGEKNWNVALLRDEGYFIRDIGENRPT